MPKCYSATTEGEVALTAATERTVVQLRGGTASKSRVIAWAVSFDGVVAADAPVVVRLLRQTTDGTATGSTEVKLDADDPTPTVTAFKTFTSTMPTDGDVLETYEIHPQGGLFVREYPPGREPVIDDVNTSRIAISCNAPQGVNCLAWMQWEE